MQKYVLSELDSGERVISERIPSVRSVALGFWIGAGSRDETDAKAGVSHFIEHLLFKGSRAYTAQQIAEIFDGLGGELNAATSREHTMVYARARGDGAGVKSTQTRVESGGIVDREGGGCSPHPEGGGGRSRAAPA